MNIYDIDAPFPWTPGQADALLRMTDQFLDDWKELADSDDEADQKASVIEWGKYRPLFALAPRMLLVLRNTMLHIANYGRVELGTPESAAIRRLIEDAIKPQNQSQEI